MRSPSAEVGDAGLGRGVVVIVLGMPRIADIDETITRWPAFCARKISIAASAWAIAATKLVIAVSRLAS